jgi:hypothetical protein
MSRAAAPVSTGQCRKARSRHCMVSSGRLTGRIASAVTGSGWDSRAPVTSGTVLPLTGDMGG